jgi:Bacterial PH domain
MMYNTDIMEQTYQNPEDFQQVRNPLEAMSPGEKIICEIKRHPIGMLSKYILAAFVFVALGILAVYVLPSLDTSSTSKVSPSQLRVFALVILLGMGAIGVLMLWISAYIYYRNRWVVTSDSITQVSQTGLFSAQMSQLSMANLQDVTVVQDGILPTMMNYGVIRAETAGERSKFVFLYCPNPKYYAQQILIARENFINSSPETAKRANDDLAVPRSSSDGLSVYSKSPGQN